MTYEFELVKRRLLTIGDQIGTAASEGLGFKWIPPELAKRKELCIIILK